MLSDSDLDAFVDIYNQAKQSLPDCLPSIPVPWLPLSEGDGLFPAEIWSLSRSAQIAAVLGDCPLEAALVLTEIAQSFGPESDPYGRYAMLTDRVAWAGAISAASQQLSKTGMQAGQRAWQARQREVGEACLRLRRAGYQVTVTAFGPKLSDASRHKIASEIDTLIRLIGGEIAASQILRTLKETNRHHDGMYLFGNHVAGVLQSVDPEVSFGWLFSLAIKHLSVKGAARKPEVAWKRVISLAIDFAATFNCQRYSQFEQLDIHPSHFHTVLIEALLWRELFSLPQAPRRMFSVLKPIFEALVTKEDEIGLGVDFKSLLREIDLLLSRTVSERLTKLPQRDVKLRCPVLWNLARAKGGSVNTLFLDPLSVASRTQESYLIFSYGTSDVLLLPTPFSTVCACEIVFRLIWTRLPADRAKEITGASLEQAIETACRGKASVIHAGQKYQVGNKEYELDVACREEERITLIETKAKSLTSKARSGDFFAYLGDYADSYLAMLKQLVRHESHLRRGLTPVTPSVEGIENLRMHKVIVSPLSYGPIGDKALANALTRSISMARLAPLSDDRDQLKATKKFNSALSEIFSFVRHLSPKRGEQADLFAYMMDVFWLDLGQLIYVLDRSTSVWEGFMPLKHMTFGTRDFWTEVAFADRQKLTSRWAAPGSH